MNETQNIEFKSIWKEEFIKNVCAFANVQGGILYIGIDDKGNAIGVDNASKLLETLPNIINNKTGIIPLVEIEKINQKYIVKIIIAPSSVSISYHGRYYMRSGTIVVELQGRALSDFLLKKSGITWDMLEIETNWNFLPDAETIEQFKTLSFDRVPFAKKEENISLLLSKLNLTSPSGILTKATILLFDKKPQRYFPQAVVKIGRFMNDADIISSDIIEGNLFQQAENALAILKTKYLISPITYEGVHRREKLQYPVEALREAIFNALIHRDYNTTSAVLIKIYNNSLSIANEGKLPPEITIADLKREHLSKPRNKLLADIFYKAGFIESWGRGTINIINECKTANIPEPNFYEEHGVVKIVFELTSISKFQNGTLNGTLNSTLQKVLDSIKTKPNIKAKEIAVILDIPRDTLNKQLRYLTNNHLIERRGSKKTGGYYAI